MPLYAHTDIEITVGGDPNTRPTFRRVARGDVLSEQDIADLGDESAAALLESGAIGETPPDDETPIAPPAPDGAIDVRAGDGGDAEDTAVVA
jgi:hypothetical protein